MFTGTRYRYGSLKIPVRLQNGSNILNVLIAENVGDAPGSPIESFNVVNQMPQFGSFNPPLVLSSDDDTLLSAGNVYWLIAALGDDTDGFAQLDGESVAQCPWTSARAR